MLRKKATDVHKAGSLDWNDAKNTKSQAHATCSDDGLTMPELQKGFNCQIRHMWQSMDNTR